MPLSLKDLKNVATALIEIQKLERENFKLKLELDRYKRKMWQLHNEMCSPDNCVLDGENCTGGDHPSSERTTYAGP
jgi:hypothetical protein